MKSADISMTIWVRLAPHGLPFSGTALSNMTISSDCLIDVLILVSPSPEVRISTNLAAPLSTIIAAVESAIALFSVVPICFEATFSDHE